MTRLIKNSLFFFFFVKFYCPAKEDACILIPCDENFILSEENNQERLYFIFNMAVQQQWSYLEFQINLIEL